MHKCTCSPRREDFGDKSRAFVSKALEVATQNPNFLPRSFDLEEMRRDLALYEALYPVLLSLTNLQGANLQGANLQGAKLEGANLQDANVLGTILEGKI